jgi:hypothetical protein
MNLPAGYSMVSSVIPVSGGVDGSLFNAPLQDGTTFVIWTGSGYNQILYSPSFQAAFGLATPWMDQNFNTVTPPSVSVGQGFFIYQPNPQAWSQTLPSN